MNTKTYNTEELQNMSPEKFNNVLLDAVEIRGTVLVRDKDGAPKYEKPELAGTYGENI